MNLSCSKAVAMPGSGETLTITCFTCGMPSSKEWAQKIRSRPSNPNKPYYPFILQVHPPLGSGIREDGSTFVCAFCHASLEAQWKNYERQQPNGVPPMNRKYNLYKFICAVCGVETYRKRVRTLPFQEFPFLANQRPAGSLTLGNNPLAIVCLDCSETLWAQSAEYDRWGLPVHKRMFNWMARPPPPEDSVEATVARLPSGETQLPRCPPIEPALGTRAKEVLPYDSLLVTSKSKSRVGKTDQINVESETTVPSRKSSFTTSSNSSLEGISAHSQPPIVTVAPMSAHSTSATSLKKDSIISPHGYSPPFKYDVQTNGIHPSSLAYPMFPRTTIYPTPYGTYPWSGREASASDRFSYSAGIEGMPSNPSWPWIPPPSGVLQYAAVNHVNPYVNRNYSNEHLYHSNHMHFSQLPSQHMDLNPPSTVPSRSTSPIVTPALTSSPPDRNGRSEHIYTSSSKSGKRHLSYEDEDLINKPQPNGRSSYGSCGKKAYKPPQLPDSENSSCSSTTMGDSCIPLEDDDIAFNPTVVNKESTQLLKRLPLSSHRILSEKKRQRKVFTAEQNTTSKLMRINAPDCVKHHYKSTTAQHVTLPSVKRKVEIDPVNWPPRSETLLPISKASASNGPSNGASKKRKIAEGSQVVDLSVTAEKMNGSRSAYSKKFMIAYLCKSDDCEPEPLSNNGTSDLSGRRSVIVAAQKPTEESVASSTNRKKTSSCQVSHKSIAEAHHRGEPSQKLRRSMSKIPDASEGTTFKHNYTERLIGASEEQVRVDTQASTTSAQGLNTSSQAITEEDIKEYANRIVTECKKAVKQEQLFKRRREAEQEAFLKSVGLITQIKKSELELDCLISRSNRHTLLPLKLRASSPPRSDVSQEFKKILLQTAFDDPSLKTSDIDKGEVTFLAHLDLKPASMGEKQRRERVWRLMLLERMKRGKRNRMLQGIPKPWNCIESITLTRVMSPIPKLCGLFSDTIQNLTVSLPSNESPDRDTSAIDRRPSSDLLSIVDAHEVNSPEPQTTSALTISAMCIVQPVISYPKYTPRYAPQLPSAKVEELDSKSEDESNCKSVNGTSATPEAVNGNIRHTCPVEPSEALPVPSLPSTDEDHCILKVPDILSALKQREVQCNIQDQTGSNRIAKPAPIPNDPHPLTLESIIRENSAHNERFLKQLTDLLGNIPTSNSRLEKNSKSWPKHLEDWRALKAFLKSRQQQIKSIEEKMKKKEKIVCSLFKYSKSAD